MEKWFYYMASSEENLIQTGTKEWGKKVKSQMFISINNPKQAKDTIK